MKIPIKKILKVTLLYILVPVLLVVAGAVGASLYVVGFAKDAYDNSNWLDVGGKGIEEEGYVTLGGHEQYVRIRGRDRANPVLLDLHGGPGGAMTALTHRAYRPLAEYFTVVEWDQRGAGKSAGEESLAATASYQRMVDDAVELIGHLQGRLGIEKVVLVGHSWGSMLGLGVAKQRPDLLHAYVGVGQVVHWQENFNESKRLMLVAAEKAGHTETAEALSTVPDSWPPKGDDEALDEYLESIQKFLGDYGASIWALKDPTDFTGSELILDAIFSPDSTISDALAFFGGGDASPATYALMHDLYDWDRINDPEDYRFETPIIIFQGEHDWQTPTPLVKPWFAKIEAPHKEYIAFENSAHFVIPEEPGKYILSLVDRVRPLAVEQPVETPEEMEPAA